MKKISWGLFYLGRLLRYYFRARHKKGFGIHSPFAYQLVRNVFQNKSPVPYSRIERLKTAIKGMDMKVPVSGHGAGSSYGSISEITIGHLLKRISVDAKYGQLLYRMVDYFKPKKILELGSGLGISTAYLALHEHNPEVHTIEASGVYAEIAQTNLQKIGANNVIVYNGFFSEKLPEVLAHLKSPDIVFFDGDHRKAATLEYFYLCKKHIHNETIFIFDDIHWSVGMEEAWQEIVNTPEVTLSVDIFRMGIIFFRKELTKQHFIIKF
jgi:predicted O-methyltransferase YrrM